MQQTGFQVVRKYTFSTKGQLHELDVMKQADAQRVRWSVYVDDKLAGTEYVETGGATDCRLPFKVTVKGMKAPLDALCFISKDSVEGVFHSGWQYRLIVCNRVIDAFWTVEEGDTYKHQDPVDVLEPVEGEDGPTFDNDFGSPSHELDDEELAGEADRLYMSHQYYNKLPEPDRVYGRGPFACCYRVKKSPDSPPKSPVKGKPRSGSYMSMLSKPDGRAPPSAQGCLQRTCANGHCKPDEHGTYKGRPMAQTCNDGSTQCYFWAEELFDNAH